MEQKQSSINRNTIAKLESWLRNSLEFSDVVRSDNSKRVIIRFWAQFYTFYLNTNNISNDIYSVTKSSLYKDAVIRFLDMSKNQELTDDNLREIQRVIEDQTMRFDEESIYKTYSNIIRMLIKKDKVSAKDYLKSKLDNPADIELLSEFNQYTIEAIIVYVLGVVFHSVDDIMVRLSSLVEQLESSVRRQASLLKSRRVKAHSPLSSGGNHPVLPTHKSKKKMLYTIGNHLINFIEERELIKYWSCSGISNDRVEKKGGSYYISTHTYVICNFDISLLPIKLNLPMVCKPIDWQSACPPGQEPRTLSDLTGGYLSGPTGEIYDRYRLLSSVNPNNFNINIDRNYENMCRVMNKLQGQAFEINSDFLKFILDNEDILYENGLLMPLFLASMNITEIYTILREMYMKDNEIQKVYSFSKLLNILSKDIQRARNERFFIKLARAFNGYRFYLPAFLDFRGRIYRCGILHFHERDLARSLVIIVDDATDKNKKDEDNNELIKRCLTAAGFHYRSCSSNEESSNFTFHLISCKEKSESLIEIARDAKHPFQFLANINNIVNNNIDLLKKMPITQDASASAYQIMSYLLLDEILAERTNLIPSPDNQIQDIYSFLLEELKEFMKEELVNNPALSKQVCEHLTRKLIKGIFMPIIYGKTLISTADELEDHLSHYITRKECFTVAKICYKFWSTKYSSMDCLIRLIRNIGWIASSSNRPVFYSSPYFTTVQDYMEMESHNLWVYDRMNKKRRKLSLRLSSSKRDRRKTEISTFVNFIHQRDASIAMSVVEKMLCEDAPMYTVHDNFITTAEHSSSLPHAYKEVFQKMDSPLSIINEFIYMNVISPVVQSESVEPINAARLANEGISIDTLSYYLNANIPVKVSKRVKATWEDRISGILTSYEMYIRLVCDDIPSSMPRSGFEAHERKLDNFKNKLKAGNSLNNYCLHH